MQIKAGNGVIDMNTESSLWHRAPLPSPTTMDVDGAFMKLESVGVGKKYHDQETAMACCRLIGRYVESGEELNQDRILVLLRILGDPSKEVARIGVCEVLESLANKGVHFSSVFVSTLATLATDDEDVVGSIQANSVLDSLVKGGQLSSDKKDELVSRAASRKQLGKMDFPRKSLTSDRQNGGPIKRFLRPLTRIVGSA